MRAIPIFKEILILCLMGFALNSTNVKAEMRVDQPLTFGSLVIKDNSQAWTLRQQSNGTITAESGIIILQPGQVGQYFYYNLPASTQVAISIIDGTGNTQFAGSATQAQFSIQPYLDIPTYTTNSFGELTLTLPAILKTSGNGLYYSDGTYYRFFKLSINY